MLEKQMADQTTAIEELSDFFHNRCSLQAHSALHEKYKNISTQKEQIESELQAEKKQQDELQALYD